MTADAEVEQYLETLRVQLGSVTLAEREEIVREITAHIRDSAEERRLPASEILARMGPPEKLAAEYCDGIFIRAASRSLSPPILLRATLRIAARGVFRMLVFLSALFGYFVGGGLIATAFLKPIFPTHVGLFGGPHSYGMGMMFPGTEAGEHELLGYWYIPAALTLGSLLIFVTSWIIRLFLRTSRRWQVRFGGKLASRHLLTKDNVGFLA